MSNQSLIKSTALKDVVQKDEVKNRLKEIMGTRAPQFAAALVQIVNQSWQLQKCDPNSVIGAALTAAALDLSIDPNLGEAHIVPYGDKATFQIGYVGFSQLAMRSGQYKNLGWTIVHEGELLDYDELSGELTVNPKNPEGKVIGYAAKFKLLNGFERGSYWTVEQITNHAKKFSKAYNAGLNDAKKQNTGWFTNFDRMALKTVLKSLLKLWGPKSIQMQKALGMDEGAVIDAETGKVEFVDSTDIPSKPDFGEPQVDAPPPAPEPPPPPLIKREPAKVKNPADEAFESAAPATEMHPEPHDTSKPEYNTLKAVKGFFGLAGIKEPQVIDFLQTNGVIEADITTLDILADKQPDVLTLLHDQNAEITAKIKGVK
jgi:recombination protein RecT